MTVRTKLISLLAAFVAGFVLILGLAFSFLPANIEDSEYHGIVLDKDLIADILPPPEFIIEAHLTAWHMAHCDDVAEAKVHAERIAVLERDYETRHVFWQEHLTDAHVRTAVLERSYEPAREYFEVVREQLAPATAANDFERATVVLEETLTPLYETHRSEIDVAVKAATDHLDEEIAVSSAAVARDRMMLGGVGLGATLLGCLLGWGIVGSVTRSVKTVNQTMDRVAARDLTARLDASGKDEFADMARSLNRALDEVSSAMRSIRSSTDDVSTASRELQSAANDISGGAQESASSLEQTAASLEQITSTIQQNADNAQQAAQLAKGANDTARAGGEVTTRAVGAMRDINEGSKKISDIITTIDEIAFQTNLLALNAAVEAARAGEQGRGFAVVASEVRNLAQRSAEAAKEIKGLIEDSLKRVERGSELVDQSGKRLTDIVDSVQKVADLIAEIAAASREQSSGIEQLNKAVGQLDQVTQQNAAQTEELSSTAQQLSTRADEMRTMVSAFSLGGANASNTAGPSGAPAKQNAARAALPTQRTTKGASPVTHNARSSGSADDLEQKLAEATHAVEGAFEEF